MKKLSRIGIFGGTFDPIHTGHLRVAEIVCEKANLEKVIFTPLKIPPHKNQESIIASASERAEMIRLAIKGNSKFALSQIELKREGVSFTIDTLKYFYKTLRSQIFFLIGSDAFLQMNEWKNFPEHFNFSIFIVFPRGEKKIDGFRCPEVELIFDGQKGFSFSGEFIYRDSKPVAQFLPIKTLNISATELRDMMRKGESIRYLVPEEVYRFIKRRRLYEYREEKVS